MAYEHGLGPFQEHWFADQPPLNRHFARRPKPL